MDSIFADKLLDGKKIAVSGASGGIGKETCKMLSRLGADLILIGSSDDRLQNLKSELDSRSCTVHVDLTNVHTLDQFVALLSDDCFPLDGFFHCAGRVIIKPSLLYSHNDFQDLFHLSAQFPLIIGQLASKKRYFNRKSSIVLMSSVSSAFGTPGMSIYSSSKAAMNSICKNLAAELSGKEIRVNAILAGAVETDMHAEISRIVPSKTFIDYRDKHLLGFGVPSDISNMAVFLLSHASRWITGSLFTVDGGFSCFK